MLQRSFRHRIYQPHSARRRLATGFKTGPPADGYTQSRLGVLTPKICPIFVIPIHPLRRDFPPQRALPAAVFPDGLQMRSLGQHLVVLGERLVNVHVAAPQVSEGRG